MAKLLPRALNSSHYRFPAQGHNYIQIPQEAFRSHGGCLGPWGRGGGTVVSPGAALSWELEVHPGKFPGGSLIT